MLMGLKVGRGSGVTRLGLFGGEIFQRVSRDGGHDHAEASKIRRSRAATIATRVTAEPSGNARFCNITKQDEPT